jgi:hypothetical protein
VPWSSNHPLLTGLTRRAPLVEIKDIRNYPPMWKRQFNNDYGTNHSASEPVIICNRKQGHYSDRRICEMMTLNEIHYDPETSTSFSKGH